MSPRVLVPARSTVRPCLSLGHLKNGSCALVCLLDISRTALKKDMDGWLFPHVAYAGQFVSKTVSAPLRCGDVASISGAFLRDG